MCPNKWEYRGHFADGRLEGYVNFHLIYASVVLVFLLVQWQFIDSVLYNFF